ncbi:hypothetical protein I600_2212 [Maribacter dokdonensis DSW-8]|nr:hypothetical protein I600_2212 [Maribacter dokdonensis DSW-8]
MIDKYRVLSNKYKEKSLLGKLKEFSKEYKVAGIRTLNVG